MRDEIEKAMDAAIKPYIEAIASGMRSGGFPMHDKTGELMNWSSWIARRQIDAVMDVVERDHAD